MSTTKFISLLVILSALYFGNAWACTSIPNTPINLISSYEAERQEYAGKKKEFEFGNCIHNADQYFIVTSAPVFTDMNYRAISSPEGVIPADKCYLDQSPFAVKTPLEAGFDKLYSDQAHVMKKCLQYEITDEAGTLNWDKQADCQLVRMSEKKALVRGSHCSFKIRKESRFILKFGLNPHCTLKSYMDENSEIYPMDINGLIGIYRAVDMTPGNPDYAMLGFISPKISIQPDSKLLPVSSYFGIETARWTTNYGAKIALGQVGITVKKGQGASNYAIKIPFVVDNNCGKVCVDKTCTSPCYYNAPAVAAISLKKKVGDSPTFRFIDWWYQGNIATAGFFGMMAFGRDVKNDEPKPGDRYLVRAEFSEPSMAYRLLKDKASQIVLDTRRSLSISTTAGSTVLRELDSLTGNMIPAPDVEGLPPVSDENSLAGVQATLTMLDNLIGANETWPPYYRKVCNNEGVCDKANSTFQIIDIEFTIASISSSGKVTMKDTILRRKSKLFGDEERAVKVWPTIKCAP
ncbi:MAG: hypothetical protein A2X86_21420 [Bdellovibrionales bacterium GWA2_49_15]|nr:MAG: hypothetical protein A2X86_21420 [Bdellovibrionales bacterium GWA2_49_15]HAZ14940.1 hypothetical protein [Bdellovibrionales bacterium]